MKIAIYITLLIFGCASAQVTQIPCEFDDTPRGYECRMPDVDLSVFNAFSCVGGTHLAGRTDANVVSFMSINNNFASFPTACIARFINLRHIKVSGSLLTELPAGAVMNRPLLETLSLNGNFIDSVNPLAFTGTLNVHSLNLGLNRLRNINNAFFQMFANLLTLDLSFNLLERIPADAFIFNPAITLLNLNANRINFMNQTFFNNINLLTTLQLDSNLCYSGSFFNLNFPQNRIDMFNRLSPTCFVQGPVLFRCQFGFEFGGIDFDNRYTCLLRGIEAYDMEKTINLGGFHVVGQTNAGVTFLWVESSNVRFFIRQMFLEFVNLYGVQIQSSGLEVIQPGSFQNAINLRRLTILMNRLERLEANTFQYATGLETISFLQNHLEYIDENAFAGLINLRELHLTGGNLVTIAPFTFRPLINLQIIEASRNFVQVLDSRW